MSKPRPPQPVKLIMSLLTGEVALIHKACSELTNRYGVIDFMSDTLAFDFTDYYEKEFGKNLQRHIISFSKLIAPEALPAIKHVTNAIEDSFTGIAGKRSINIDPGYITLYHLILATCKRFSHRPYLRDGVYADLTLIFQAKTFQPLPWTFPDYGSAGLIALLNTIRDTYLHQLKTGDRKFTPRKDVFTKPASGLKAKINPKLL